MRSKKENKLTPRVETNTEDEKESNNETEKISTNKENKTSRIAGVVAGVSPFYCPLPSKKSIIN